MIQRQTAVRFYVGEQEFNTLREAQAAELGMLLNETIPAAEVGGAVEAILNYALRIMDILTTTESSLTKARKINGGRKTRKRALPVVPATGNPVTTTDT